MGRRLMAARIVRPLLIALVGAAALVVALAGVAAAADPVFGRPTATASFGKTIEFVQPATVSSDIKRVEILLEFPSAGGPLAAEVDAAARRGEVTFRHQLVLAESHLLPNTTITARWRLTGEDGSVSVGPPATVRYEDTRFKWRTRSGDIVRVHWYEGTEAFGNRALDIGERAVRETSTLLGVTEKEPIDFFVYADQAAFYDALGPGTRENVGGQANAEIRTLFALITPAEIDADWVGIVIPHELTHLVFNTAVDNPYHFPPRWLNEGLAVYLSQGYGSDDRRGVEAAAADGTLMPLDSLSGQFPTTRDRFFLAYAESISSVDYLVRKYGPDALVALIKSYATGLTDDEAFTKALGVDVATFDAAWRAELKAREPTVHGPGPAPAGPLPPGWTDANGLPGATLPPAGPRASRGSPAAPGPGSSVPASSGRAWLPAIGAGVGLALAAGLLGYLVARRRQRRPRVAWTPVTPFDQGSPPAATPSADPTQGTPAQDAPSAPSAGDPTAAEPPPERRDDP